MLHRSVTVIALTFILLYPDKAFASLEATISYINQLLESQGKVAIVLIDMQQAFSKEFSAIGFRARNLQIIKDQAQLISHFSSTPNVEFINVRQRRSEADIELLPELQSPIRKAKVLWHFFKTQNNVFYETSINVGQVNYGKLIEGELAPHLKANGIQDVVLTGCFADRCIYSSAKGAIENGLKVHIDHDMNIINSLGASSESTTSKIQQQTEQAWQKLESDFPENLTLIKKQPATCTT